jgi:hypothetical protein
MNTANIYSSPRFLVLVDFVGDGKPLTAACKCEISSLMPLAILAFQIEALGTAAEIDWDFELVIGPEGEADVWVKVEEGPWIKESSWDFTSLEPDEAVDDLTEALDGDDPERVFRAFTQLRGGSVEFAGWLKDGSHQWNPFILPINSSSRRTS